MFNIFIKPLNSSINRFIFFGYFGNLDDINEAVKECIYLPMKDDPIYNRSLIQKYPCRFFEVMLKDINNDDKVVFLKVFDVEKHKFIEED
jgi:hypothetical protein